jgi:hypothetical protein
MTLDLRQLRTPIPSMAMYKYAAAELGLPRGQLLAEVPDNAH